MYGPRDAGGPTRISWERADRAYSVYSSRFGKGQTLERLAERGGFWASELDTLIPGWRETEQENELLRSLMERDDELRDMQRHGIYTPEQMQHAWQVHRKEWEDALARRTDSQALDTDQDP